MQMKLQSYIENYAATKIPAKYGPLDNNGVPLFDVKHVRLRSSLAYHPIVIIQYGLAHHTLLQNGEVSAKDVFLKCAGWLEENAEKETRERFLVWNYPFRLRTPPVAPPWFSGMAQGQAISLLLRAYEHTKSERTADVAKHAALSFLYELKDGGVLTRTVGGNYFVEELAYPPATHILNGCLFGLVGLYEYLLIFPDPRLKGVLTSCIRGVEEVLRDFDLGWWSRYSLGFRWNAASFHYHHIHISLLNYLGERCESSVFLDYALRWDSYEKSRMKRLRRHVIEIIERNWNRSLTVLKLNHVRYRKVNSFIQ